MSLLRGSNRFGSVKFATPKNQKTRAGWLTVSCKVKFQEKELGVLKSSSEEKDGIRLSLIEDMEQTQKDLMETKRTAAKYERAAADIRSQLDIMTDAKQSLGEELEFKKRELETLMATSNSLSEANVELNEALTSLKKEHTATEAARITLQDKLRRVKQDKEELEAVIFSQVDQTEELMKKSQKTLNDEKLRYRDSSRGSDLNTMGLDGSHTDHRSDSASIASDRVSDRGALRKKIGNLRASGSKEDLKKEDEHDKSVLMNLAKKLEEFND